MKSMNSFEYQQYQWKSNTDDAIRSRYEADEIRQVAGEAGVCLECMKKGWDGKCTNKFHKEGGE